MNSTKKANHTVLLSGDSIPATKPRHPCCTVFLEVVTVSLSLRLVEVILTLQADSLLLQSIAINIFMIIMQGL